MIFQKQDVVLKVSRIDSNGFWIENCKEHVSKGTALGNDFTENIYIPSKEGMTAKYDRDTGTWDEIKNRSFDVYFDEFGRRHTIGVPDGEFPKNAIKETPPEYNEDKQTILYLNGKGWSIYDIKIGESYWCNEGKEHTVTNFNFDLPDECTWNAPPVVENGYGVKLVDGEWQKVKDLRGETIYNTFNTNESEVVRELGEVKEGWVLEKPITKFDTWINSAWVTDLQAEFEAQVIKVDDTRRSLYSSMFEPLISEANFERLLNNEEAAVELETQAIAVREKIRTENPWPSAPGV